MLYYKIIARSDHEAAVPITEKPGVVVHCTRKLVNLFAK